jgi:hypothetical protein
MRAKRGTPRPGSLRPSGRLGWAPPAARTLLDQICERDPMRRRTCRAGSRSRYALRTRAPRPSNSSSCSLCEGQHGEPPRYGSYSARAAPDSLRAVSPVLPRWHPTRRIESGEDPPKRVEAGQDPTTPTDVARSHDRRRVRRHPLTWVQPARDNAVISRRLWAETMIVLTDAARASSAFGLRYHRMSAANTEGVAALAIVCYKPRRSPEPKTPGWKPAAAKSGEGLADRTSRATV